MSVPPPPFELFLASLMEAVEGVIARGARLGITAGDVDAFRAREAAGFWAPAALDYYGERLPLAGIDADPASGLHRHRFELALWPDFQLAVLVGPDGSPLPPSFVRPPGAVASLPADPRSLAAWSATVDEVVERYGPPLDESSWDLRRWLTYEVEEERWTLTFDLGLLQDARPELRGAVADHPDEGV
jgi:hypothetical protein